MRCKLLFIAVVWLCQVSIFAQNKIQKLPPGSPTPDVKLKVYRGDKPEEIRLRGLKSKLVILDYWSEGCSSCIIAMPKLDSLQRIFGDSIAIILVTQQPKAGADKLFKRVTIARPNLMMVYGDTLLRKFFPHNAVPHHIWLEPQGTIRYETGGHNATEKNFRKFLSDVELSLAYENQEEDFDFHTPFYVPDSGKLISGAIRYSALLGKIAEFGGTVCGLFNDSARNVIGLRMFNMPILTLYKIAFGGAVSGGKFEYNSKVRLEVSRRARFQYPEKAEERDSWSAENLFSYELRLKNGKIQDCFDQLRTDLLKSLPFVAEVKALYTTSYVLVKFGENNLLATKFPNSNSGEFDMHLKNVSYDILIKRLREFSGTFEFPLAVEYQYEGNIDFDWPEYLPGHIITVDELRQYLRKRGLDLVKKEAMQEMLVIRDKVQ